MTHKPKKLTPKQVQFVLAYRETGNGTEAYRRVYNTTNMAPKTINREATRLLDHPLINARLAELEAEDRIRCAVTVELLTEKLWEDRELARQNEHPQAAINATMAVAKLHGLVDAEAPPAPGPNLKLILGGVDEDELMRRYAETILLRQQRRKRLTHAGNGRGNGSDLRP
jgi:hypothetical protein